MDAGVHILVHVGVHLVMHVRMLGVQGLDMGIRRHVLLRGNLLLLLDGLRFLHGLFRGRFFHRFRRLDGDCERETTACHYCDEF